MASRTASSSIDPATSSIGRDCPASTGTFAPPVILNPGRPARAITLVRIGSRYGIAAADAHDEPTASAGQFVFTVSIYTVGPGGAVSRLTAFSTSALPTSLAAADLTGDGLDDLIAANALNDSVTIALQTAPGTFAAPITMPVGIAPSDIAVGRPQRRPARRTSSSPTRPRAK